MQKTTSALFMRSDQVKVLYPSLAEIDCQLTGVSCLLCVLVSFSCPCEAVRALHMLERCNVRHQACSETTTLRGEGPLPRIRESLSIVVDEISRSGGDGPGAAVAVGRRHTPLL